MLADARKHRELPELTLQTVCSGTDAPSLALSIVEQVLAAECGFALNVNHQTSCENDAFKQAYLARNFPGVTLFRDVVELGSAATDGAEAPTAFGGRKPVPTEPFLLVAGTSCKGAPSCPVPPVSLTRARRERTRSHASSKLSLALFDSVNGASHRLFRPEKCAPKVHRGHGHLR